MTNEPIAVIGASIRVAGANNLEEFWDMIKSGKDGRSPVPENRWNSQVLYDPNASKGKGKVITKHAYFCDKIDEFDATYFGIPLAEAKTIDPQQRMLLQLVVEALEGKAIYIY
jgi:myxalamid-type polyketide synthase MxaB